MDFGDLFNRVNFNCLIDLILYGAENCMPSSSKTYAQRLKEANANARKFFKARYPNIDEYDEIVGYYNAQIGTYTEVYFEVGLLLGAKIGYQICTRLKELGANSEREWEEKTIE